MLPVPNFAEGEYLTIITRFGRIKRVALSEFQHVRSNGLIAINRDEANALDWVKMTLGGQDMSLVSAHGKAIRFTERDVRAMGRAVQTTELLSKQVPAFYNAFVSRSPDESCLII